MDGGEGQFFQKVGSGKQGLDSDRITEGIEEGNEDVAVTEFGFAVAAEPFAAKFAETVEEFGLAENPLSTFGWAFS